MTHVIAEPCIGTKDTSCVDVCPVTDLAERVLIDELRIRYRRSGDP